ncbi:MAG: magnesium chelatase domain-containing protein, partial [Enterococcus thailandicus]|nr:magnesium chelatase domain-containing protein [Enterococcus thailandicus]
GGLAVSGSDAYLNVIGGLELDDTAADLATILAIASSHLDRPVGSDLVAIGEIGLTGEIRSVNAMEQRLCEIARLGFNRCVIPAHVRGEIRVPKSLELLSVKNVREAIAAVLY